MEVWRLHMKTVSTLETIINNNSYNCILYIQFVHIPRYAYNFRMHYNFFQFLDKVVQSTSSADLLAKRIA